MLAAQKYDNLFFELLYSGSAVVADIFAVAVSVNSSAAVLEGLPDSLSVNLHDSAWFEGRRDKVLRVGLDEA